MTGASNIRLSNSPVDMLGDVRHDFTGLAAIVRVAVERMEDANLCVDRASPSVEAEDDLCCLLYDLDRRAARLKEYLAQAMARIDADIRADNSEKSTG
ncbi:MAG: hypothetical protein L0I29_16735 [Hyphomicrobiales bacterium]|nr:hypothetical protein [Hyphomicrobiales bacterium]